MKKDIKLTEVILKAFLTCFLPVMAILFECDPDGAIIETADAAGGASRVTVCYFYPVYLGNVNFFPFLTALLSVLLLLIGAMYLLSGAEKGVIAESALAFAAFFISLIPLATEVITTPGIAISALLLLQSVVSFSLYRQIRKTSR